MVLSTIEPSTTSMSDEQQYGWDHVACARAVRPLTSLSWTPIRVIPRPRTHTVAVSVVVSFLTLIFPSYLETPKRVAQKTTHTIRATELSTANNRPLALATVQGIDKTKHNSRPKSKSIHCLSLHYYCCSNYCSNKKTHFEPQANSPVRCK